MKTQTTLTEAKLTDWLIAAFTIILVTLAFREPIAYLLAVILAAEL